VTDYPQLVEAVTTFVVRATLKLRSQDTLCSKVSVFISSSPFIRDSNYYHNLTTVGLANPTSNTGLILKGSLEGLRSIYKNNIAYVKCGVILSGLINSENSQDNLWPVDDKRKGDLVFVMDKINNRFNGSTLRLGTQPLYPTWGARQLKKSPSYTTSWKELLVVS
jgi:DNA polymerase V